MVADGRKGKDIGTSALQPLTETWSKCFFLPNEHVHPLPSQGEECFFDADVGLGTCFQEPDAKFICKGLALFPGNDLVTTMGTCPTVSTWRCKLRLH